MTLAIGVRCTDGRVVIADRRTINQHGEVLLEDFEKIATIKGVILYNHGYNWIGRTDWKKRQDDLRPDFWSPLYDEIRTELSKNTDKSLKACYVFFDSGGFVEASVDHDRIAFGRFSGWWLKSGDGRAYVKADELNALRDCRVADVMEKLPDLLRRAHARAVSANYFGMNDRFTMHAVIDATGEVLFREG